MGYIEDLPDRLQMDVKNWPHQFTKNGQTVQVGDDEGWPKFATPMVCVHCQVEFLNGKEGRPPDPCPARGKEQVKRILDGR